MRIFQWVLIVLLLLQICFVLLCNERDFKLSLTDYNQTDIIEVFNCTFRYLDDLLNIDNPYFEQRVGQTYPTQLHLKKTHSSDTQDSILDLYLFIMNGISLSKIYDKRVDFNFEIVKFALSLEMFLAPLHISQLIRFVSVYSNVDDF